jgi:5'-AMP-activated protein kinase catalytic alpha subunit
MDADAVFGPNENNSSITESKGEELAKPCNLNAFDIISFSACFDLSGLFEETDQKKEKERKEHREEGFLLVESKTTPF